MKCHSCGKENRPAAKFCKYCGGKIEFKYKTCQNGHNFHAKLDNCPYCPKPEVTKSINDAITSAKTMIERSTDLDVPAQPTILDENNTTIELENKTVIDKTDTPKTASSEATALQTGQKLAGWLVTYDIDPNGTDFKLYEGRIKIGKDPLNDIVLNEPDVTDEHVLIMCRDNKFVLQDQLSAKGTYVNNKIENGRVELNDGDEIKIGNISLKIKII
jgi:hypothetical protein